MPEIKRLTDQWGPFHSETPTTKVADQWETEPPEDIRYPGMIVFVGVGDWVGADDLWQPQEGPGWYGWNGSNWVPLNTLEFGMGLDGGTWSSGGTILFDGGVWTDYYEGGQWTGWLDL